jgi:hypothetical protein
MHPKTTAIYSKEWRNCYREDLFGNILKWIDLFKQTGDTAVQYDPVHAALPWAGVWFLLQVCGSSSTAESITEMYLDCDQ